MKNTQTITCVSHLPPFCQSFILNLHEQFNLPIDGLNFLLTLIFNAIVISFIYQRIHVKLHRHLFGMFCGIFTWFWIYGFLKTFVLTSGMALMYPLIIYFKNPYLIFWFTQLTLIGVDFYRFSFYYLQDWIDISYVLIGFAIRMHTLTWDLSDGQNIVDKKPLGVQFSKEAKYRLSSAYDYGAQPPAQPRRQQKKQNEQKNTELSFFEYFAYMSFFGHCMCTSNLTINEYLHISDLSIYERNGWRRPESITKKSKNKNSKESGNMIAQQNTVIPYASATVILKQMLELICVTVVFIISNQYFTLDEFHSSEFAVYSSTSAESADDHNKNHEFLRTMLWIGFCGYCQIIKYFFFWSIADLLNIMSGIGFLNAKYIAIDDKNKQSDDKASTKTAEPKKETDDKEAEQICWTRVKNVNILKVLTSQNTKDCTRNWNMTVNHWLTYYVYMRIEPHSLFTQLIGSQKQAKIVLTRITSAMMHGIYSAYYIFFALSICITTVIEQWHQILPTYKNIMKHAVDKTDMNGADARAFVGIFVRIRKRLYPNLVFLCWMFAVNINLGFVMHFYVNKDSIQVIRMYNKLNWVPFILLLLAFIVGKIILLFKHRDQNRIKYQRNKEVNEAMTKINAHKRTKKD